MRAPSTRPARVSPRGSAARHLPGQARLREDARASGRRAVEAGRIHVRGPEARRQPPPLRLPAGDRRRPQELGRSQGTEPRSCRQAPRHADRGSSARVRRLRGHHPRGRVRRRHGPRSGIAAPGSRHRDPAPGVPRRPAEVHAPGREASRRLDAGPPPRPRSARRGRPELAPHQGTGRGSPSGERRSTSPRPGPRASSATGVSRTSRAPRDKTWHSNRSSAKTARRAPSTASGRPRAARADRGAIPGARPGRCRISSRRSSRPSSPRRPPATSGSTR